MANNQEGKPLTAAQVEEQRRQAEEQEAQKNQNITVNDQQVSPPSPQTQTQQEVTKTGGTGGGNKINKIALQTQFIKIEISDPNILDEINTEGKYPDQLNFERLECNINIHGGRVSLTTDDKMGKSKEILSGISKKEIETVKTWNVERG